MYLFVQEKDIAKLEADIAKRNFETGKYEQLLNRELGQYDHYNELMNIIPNDVFEKLIDQDEKELKQMSYQQLNYASGRYQFQIEILSSFKKFSSFHSRNLKLSGLHVMVYQHRTRMMHGNCNEYLKFIHTDVHYLFLQSERIKCI